MFLKIAITTACGFATSVSALQATKGTPLGSGGSATMNKAPPGSRIPKIDPGTTISVLPVASYNPEDPYTTKGDSLKVKTTGKTLGEGTYGICYEVDVLSGLEKVKKAVVKVINLHSLNARQLAPLEKEFAANHYFSQDTNSHPAIMKAYGMFWDTHQQLAFLVMPYVPGVELFVAIHEDEREKYNKNIQDEARRLRQRVDKSKLLQPVSLEDKQIITVQLIAAVAHMHEHRWMHKDIKPENCLWDPKNKKILLFDFGFAMHMRESAKDYVVCGTPAYMAPEIVRDLNASEIALRTGHSLPVDVWAIGIFMFELFSNGFTPFQVRYGSQHDRFYLMNILRGRRTYRSRVEAKLYTTISCAFWHLLYTVQLSFALNIRIIEFEIKFQNVTQLNSISFSESTCFFSVCNSKLPNMFSNLFIPSLGSCPR